MTVESGGEATISGGADDRLLPWGRVKEIAGISRATAWRMQKTGDFPEPVPVSPNRVAWWESELTAWKATRKASGRARPRPFAPPREPRLIETARSAKPVAKSVKATPTPVLPQQGLLLLETLGRKPQRRARRVSPDQIDFGF